MMAKVAANTVQFFCNCLLMDTETQKFDSHCSNSLEPSTWARVKNSVK